MASAEAGISYMDPTFKIDLKVTGKPIISEKDGLLPKFEDIVKEINF
jgi:dTDP-4-dehydrorhamnose 3,5-epimerase-like enzyme